MGLLDLFMGDPRMKIAQALGQGPGQPGGSPVAPGAAPGGPAPPGPPTGGAGPAGPGGGPGGPDGAPGGSPAPPPQPQAQAYTSPPDLIGMYTQLAQRQQANDQLNRGLGMMAAAFSPARDRAMILNATSQGSGNADDYMHNVIALQQFKQQQDQYQAVQAAAPALATQLFGDTSPESMTKAKAIIASGKFGDIEGNLAGVGGSPAWQAQKKAELALTNAGKPVPWTPGDPDSYNAYKIRTDKEAGDQQHDLDADKANFTTAKAAYDKMIGDAQWLTAPDQAAAMKENIGLGGKLTPYSALSDAGKAWFIKYKQVMAEQYAAGVQDFKGAGRITQTELKQDAPSQSTMGELNQTAETFTKGAQDYIDRLSDHRAQLFGKAGQLNSPDLSDDDFNRVNSIYKDGGDLFAKGQQARRAAAPKAPAPSGGGGGGAGSGPTDLRSSKDPDADYEKLPKGAEFIGPDGKRYRK